VKISDIYSDSWNGRDATPHLAPLLRKHGVDLCAAPAPAALERGTPVYVTADADPIEVQRRMVQAHVRMLFVLDGDAVKGTIDIGELASRAEDLAWETGTSSSPTEATA